jgi:hypothetical protein
MSTVATSILVLADLLAQPASFSESCVNEDLGFDCSVQGAVQVRVVDPNRFLIAVDVEPTGGKVDHLFLVAGVPHNIVSSANPLPGTVVVRFAEKEVEVRRTDLDLVLIDFTPGALAHYWGYGNGEGGSLEDLDDLRQSDFCDGAAGSCWETNGWRIHFPL